jgi:hypothetical protein
MLIMLFTLIFLISCDKSVEPNEIISRVTGIVVDDSTNTPIDSARVYISTTAVSYNNNYFSFGYSTICSSNADEKGIYLLNANLKKDKTYYLCASKSGYSPISVYSYSKRIIISYEVHQHIDIRLKKY